MDCKKPMKFSETQIKKAHEQISQLIEEIHIKLDVAKKIADEHNLTFTFNVGYRTMGGTYYGKGTEKSKFDYISKKSKSKIRDQGEWISSTQECS